MQTTPVSGPRPSRHHAGLLKLGLEFFLANGADGLRGDRRRADLPGPEAARHPQHRRRRRPSGAAVAAEDADDPCIRRFGDDPGRAPGRRRRRRRPADDPGGDRADQPRSDRSAIAVGRLPRQPAEQVLRLGRLAIEAGADGLVCSPLEVAMLRQALGPAVKLVVPGIRPEGAASGDQARTMTPAQAIAAGADWIVVGRPITAARDPGMAAADIAAGIR